MKTLLAASLLFAISLLSGSPVFAQPETAESLALKLQKQLLASPAVEMKFTLDVEGPISIKADLKHKKIRIESPTMLIISDGKTIWNRNKATNHITIDAIGDRSAFHDPSSLFRFSDNYTSKLVTTVGHVLIMQLTLTPKDDLKPLLKAAGDLQEIILDLQHDGDHLKIYRAVATNAKGASEIRDLTIKPIKKIRTSDFTMKITKEMKVLDLRE